MIVRFVPGRRLEVAKNSERASGWSCLRETLTFSLCELIEDVERKEALSRLAKPPVVVESFILDEQGFGQ